jgi:filamentous hemagglutinin family protein
MMATRFSRPYRLSLMALVITLLYSQCGVVLALPLGEQVVSGQVAVSRPDSRRMVINQGSASAIVNWNNFSVGAGEHVNIVQPGPESVILNRVVGSSPSAIFGRLSANGKVFLVNPAGVLFGAGAVIDVGSLVASTLSIGDADFLAGRLHFGVTGTPGTAGRVDNLGSLQAAGRGTIALLGAQVRNDGTITARLGTVGLAAGARMTLDFNGDGLTRIVVDQAAVDALVANRGMVIADGGAVLMTVQAATALTRTVLAQQGIVQARSLVERDGRIVLDGGDTGVTLAGGTLDVSGTSAGRRGGNVTLSGRDINLSGNAVVDARGDAGGGNVLISATNALTAGASTRLRADAIGQGDGGQVRVLATQSARFAGSASARGGDKGGNGGLIETSGKVLDVAGARVDAAAPSGRSGTWLLDPTDITIDSGPVVPVYSDVPVPVSPSSSVSAAIISSTLSAGTSVAISTSSSGTEPGNITVLNGITHTGPADVMLTLNAHSNIVVAPGVQITASGSAGRLNVDFNADSQNAGVGAILLDTGSVIRTNGGNVRFYGGSDPVAGAAKGAAGQIYTANTFSTIDGGITLNRAGIDVGSATAAVAGGSVQLRGTGLLPSSQTDKTTGAGIALHESSITGGGAAFVIDGVAANVPNGIGIEARNTSISTTGTLGLTGSGFQDSGVSLSASSLLSGGRLSLTGFSGSGNGVRIASAGSLATDGGGAIDLRGRTSDSGASSAGVLIADSSVSVVGGQGVTTISGESAGSGVPGLQITGSSVIGGATTSGDIVLRALNAADPAGRRSNMIALAGTLRSSGMLNVRPGGVAADGQLSEAVAVPINLFAPLTATDFVLDGATFGTVIEPGFSAVVIGSAAHAGRITAFNRAPFGGGNDITLQNGGTGSAGIVLERGLSAAGRLVTLSSGGVVTQGGPITAASLLLHGMQPESRFPLVDGANAVGRVSAHFDLPRNTAVTGAGDTDFFTTGDLMITSLTGIGSAATSALPTPIASPGSVIAHDVVLRAGQNLILNQSIATLGSDITLVAGQAFINSGNAMLTPGGTGVWNIFAATQTGEQRGGLAGTAGSGNIYGCAYGVPCGSPAQASGNHFVYAFQPAIDIALVAQDAIRRYGGANVGLRSTVNGLLNGDTVGTAVTGSYTGAGTQVGTTALTNNFFSPVGYRIQVAPALLTIAPVTLAYQAAAASRLQGNANPLLGGTVSGLVGSETLAEATTGSAVFTSSASAASLPGQYAISGGGLSARNYVFVQAAANALALRVDGLPDTVLLAVAPVLARDVTQASSDLYGKNIGTQGICASASPLAVLATGNVTADRLALEWSRVKSSPNLSNCIALMTRNRCEAY